MLTAAENDFHSSHFSHKCCFVTEGGRIVTA